MPGALFLAGERVELRTIESEDIEAVRRWMNHTEIRRYIDEFRYPTSRTEYEVGGRRRLEWPCGPPDLCRRRPRGPNSTGPTRRDTGMGNLGFVIGPDHCHNGYATEAADLIVEYAFTELRLHRLEEGPRAERGITARTRDTRIRPGRTTTGSPSSTASTSTRCGTASCVPSGPIRPAIPTARDRVRSAALDRSFGSITGREPTPPDRGP